VFPIRHCERSEAIQGEYSGANRQMDCFAALAMTTEPDLERQEFATPGNVTDTD